MTTDPKEHIAGQLRDQARACEIMGSPMYADLLERAARDLERGGVVFELLHQHVLPGRGDALALRLMAAVHRLVLNGTAEELVELYPGVSETAYDRSRADEYWAAFEQTLRKHFEQVETLFELPCQTNEVGRCAPLAAGFLRVAARFEMPLRILEVGTSAGLNLRWDHYRYDVDGEHCFGPVDSPVRLDQHWRSPPRHVRQPVEVVERRGCDLRPQDPTTEEGFLRIASSVWGDQVQRFQRLKGAVKVCRRVPATVQRASLEQWLRDELAELRPGVATVVFHSVVDQYLSSEVREKFHAILATTAEMASQEAPFAHLRMEPIPQLANHGVELTMWPGGQNEMLAKCGGHGKDVEWL